jgi:hypothetical protein
MKWILILSLILILIQSLKEGWEAKGSEKSSLTRTLS